MFPTILFFIFAGVLIGAALGVILSRNPVYSALLLVLCFFNSAVIWVLLDAEFLGIVLVLVYVGAVMVLFLFVVMMLDVNIEQLRKEFAGYWPLTVAVAGFVVFAMINVIVVKQNAHEIEQMTSIATDLGIPHMIYSNISPTIYGGPESLPAQSVEHLRRRKPFTGCNAGHTSSTPTRTAWPASARSAATRRSR